MFLDRVAYLALEPCDRLAPVLAHQQSCRVERCSADVLPVESQDTRPIDANSEESRHFDLKREVPVEDRLVCRRRFDLEEVPAIATWLEHVRDGEELIGAQVRLKNRTALEQRRARRSCKRRDIGSCFRIRVPIFSGRNTQTIPKERRCRALDFRAFCLAQFPNILGPGRRFGRPMT